MGEHVGAHSRFFYVCVSLCCILPLVPSGIIFGVASQKGHSFAGTVVDKWIPALGGTGTYVVVCICLACIAWLVTLVVFIVLVVRYLHGTSCVYLCDSDVYDDTVLSYYSGDDGDDDDVLESMGAMRSNGRNDTRSLASYQPGGRYG